MLEQIPENDVVRKYWPDSKDMKKAPNREFVFSIIASLKPDFTKRILDHALDLRQKNDFKFD